MDTIYIVYAVVFIAALALIEGVMLFLRDLRYGKEGQQINRRLRMLSAGDTGQDVLRKLTRHGEQGLARFRMVRALGKLLDRAGLTISTERLLLLLGAGWLMLLLILGGILHRGWGEAAIFASAGALGLPLLAIARRAKARMKKFEMQLPEAVEMIIRSLRAGHPIASAIGLVAREMPDPIGTEFGVVFDEMTYGLDLRDALEKMAARVENEELHYLVVAVRIQFGTGGNLAEVLASLAKVLRDRSQMQAKIQAWSAEGRLSGLVLSLLPFVVGGAIMATSPNYFIDVKDDPLFPVLIGIGGTGLLLGIFMLHRMVNFRY